jgi:putative heme-binding domain-containing protein
VQAVRAIADQFDPILVERRLEATRGDPGIARRLSALGRGGEPRLLLEVTVALGRLRWIGAPEWLRANLGTPDPTLAHAAVQTLRRSRNWPSVLEWLEARDNSPLRPIALRALAGQAEVEAVDGLIRRLGTSQDPRRRREYAELLSRVHRKPGPWAYWGFRPGPRPPNSESWARTEAIEMALDRTLYDPDREVRLATIQQMEREKIRVPPETLARWMRGETKFESVAGILASYDSSKGGPLKIDTGIERKSAPERHGRLTQLAIADGGNPVRGREIFFNGEKSGCIKCHRLGDQGAAIGPDLTGAGGRFSRIHIIESILEPSRAIAPAFRNLSIRLKDGQELAGVRVAETESVLTLGDAQGQSHALKKDQIEELQILELSIMPEGLESGLTDTEFVDLVAFLAEQK